MRKVRFPPVSHAVLSSLTQTWLLLTGNAEPRDLAAGTGLVESIIAGLVLSTSVFLVMASKLAAFLFDLGL